MDTVRALGLAQGCLQPKHWNLLDAQEMEKAYAAARQFGCNSVAEVCTRAASQQPPAGTEVEPSSSVSQEHNVRAAAADTGPAAGACPGENMLPASVQDAAHHHPSGKSPRAASKRGQAAMQPLGMLDNSAACKRASLSGPKAQPAWTQGSSDTNDFTF